MFDWLYSLPDWLLLAIWSGSLALLIVVLPSLTHRVPWLRPSPENTDFVLRLQPTLFTVTSFVVAFTLFEAQNNIRKIDALVSSEAAQINRLDRLLTRYDDGSASQARTHLLAYARSVIAEEWPEMLRGGNGKTQEAFALVARSIMALEPRGPQIALHPEILRSVDSVAEARDLRLKGATARLSATFWQTILFAVLMLILVSSAIERTPFRSLVLACQMAVLGAFIGFVFIMDNPLKGRSAVEPKAIAQTITIIEGRKG
jgi:hypothetical protein